jgi:hypothetical protein
MFKKTNGAFPHMIYTSVLPIRLRLFGFHLHGPAPLCHWAMSLLDLLSLGAKAKPLVLYCLIYITKAKPSHKPTLYTSCIFVYKMLIT